MSLRVGRISYANMAPVFFDLGGAEIDQVPGVPTDLNRKLLAGEIDVAPMSSIEYARNADKLRLLPRLCVSAEGVIDSIQLITRLPLERVRTVAVTPESATSVVLTRVLLGDVELVPLGEEADAKMLIGDAALGSAFDDPTPHYDLSRLWQERTGLPMVFAVWGARADVTDGLYELEQAHLHSLAAARERPEELARQSAERYGWPAGFLARYFEKLRYHFGPREREGLVRFYELAHEVGRAGQGAGVGVRGHGGGEVMAVTVKTTVDEALEKALAGERISDDDAAALMRSRELVRIGRVADVIRNRKNPADVVTFVVDRNLNYSNICYTDCNFCAFYRRPGDAREGYTLPRSVIFKKIEETLEVDGTAVLMQGGHNPDLGIDWYEDLFTSIKARYPIHLHALSPSEIQHISRKAKLTPSETLSRLRDAGLDSLPGGGAEILSDRVRRIISPTKTKSDEWLGIMRAAHRLGMSTTATMMWGHVETLDERVLHMRRIRELQDEMHGFRAFISWTYQPDNTVLSKDVHWTPTSFDYLLMQAISRIYLDNVDHIQSSWVTQGVKVGQLALRFGADDMGSIMIEENVVSAAGTTHRASTEDFLHLIRTAGYRPSQRDTLYRTVKDYPAAA